MSIWLIGVGTLGSVSCGAGSLAPPPTNDGGDGVPRVDAGTDVNTMVASCAISHTVCDGLRVRRCVGNRGDTVVEVCETACSLGRCTSQACADVERVEATRGCRFYGAQSDNIDSDDDENLMVILSNAQAVPTAAQLDVRDLDGTWRTLTSATIRAFGSVRLEVARAAPEVGVTPGGAYRVETDGPVLAVQIVSDDLDRAARSSGGTVLRPVQGLGSEYLAVTAPAQESPEVARTPGSRGGAGALTIIATAVDTHVHVDVAAPALVYPGGRVDPPGSYDIILGDGDVLQIFSATAAGDLTGSVISSDYPVAVFSGNIFTTYGYALGTANGGDLAQEQLPPITSWNTEYVGVRVSPQEGCEPFFGVGAGFWRVVASHDDTEVTMIPARGVLVDTPTLPPDMKFRLARGGSQSFFARSERGTSNSADFYVFATYPILLAQWLDCEPGLSWGLDTRFGGGDLRFTLPPGFDHEMVVVRKIGTTVLFDDRVLPDSRWTPVADGIGYEVIRLGAAYLSPCMDAIDHCDHHLSGPEFNVTWRGMDIVCSYSLTVPSWDTCALPTMPCAR